MKSKKDSGLPFGAEAVIEALESNQVLLVVRPGLLPGIICSYLCATAKLLGKNTRILALHPERALETLSQNRARLSNKPSAILIGWGKDKKDEVLALVGEFNSLGCPVRALVDSDDPQAVEKLAQMLQARIEGQEPADTGIIIQLIKDSLGVASQTEETRAYIAYYLAFYGLSTSDAKNYYLSRFVHAVHSVARGENPLNPVGADVVAGSVLLRCATHDRGGFLVSSAYGEELVDHGLTRVTNPTKDLPNALAAGGHLFLIRLNLTVRLPAASDTPPWYVGSSPRKKVQALQIVLSSAFTPDQRAAISDWLHNSSIRCEQSDFSFTVSPKGGDAHYFLLVGSLTSEKLKEVAGIS